MCPSRQAHAPIGYIACDCPMARGCTAPLTAQRKNEVSTLPVIASTAAISASRRRPSFRRPHTEAMPTAAAVEPTCAMPRKGE